MSDHTSLRTRPRRLGRCAAAGLLLGALVINGPWTVNAAAHDGRQATSGDRERLARLNGLVGTYSRLFGDHDHGYDDGHRFPSLAALAAVTRASPVSGFPISAAYGIVGSWAAGHHTGVDFATPTGTRVRSVGPGTVVLAGYSGDYGNVVVVRMTDGYFALYAHLSRISVGEGQYVTAGTKIGETGSTGRSSGPHLHFEVRAGRDYGTDVDPIAYLARHGVFVI